MTVWLTQTLIYHILYIIYHISYSIFSLSYIIHHVSCIMYHASLNMYYVCHDVDRQRASAFETWSDQLKIVCCDAVFPKSRHKHWHNTNTYQIFIILPQFELACTEQLFTTIIKYCNFVHGVHCSLILIHSQKLKHVMTPLSISFQRSTDNTIQYNTIQYNTLQYNTIQFNTIQYNRLLLSPVRATLPKTLSTVNWQLPIVGIWVGGKGGSP